MAQRFSYDDIYKIYAWRDNNTKLVLTQGEGLPDNVSSYSNTYVKTAKFQLRDEQGIIPITSDTAATLALKKSNGEEALIEMFTSYTSSSTTLTNDKSNGIVTFAIKRSMTDVPGEMKGEIRLTTSTGIIKFFGIRFHVYDGVSNAAAEQSEKFSALVAQTNKVEALLENADSFGNLTNLDDTIAHGGTHPVTSGIIYDYLVNNYVPKTTQIAGLDLQDDITAAELRTALNVPQVYERTRRPTEADGERVGQFWVAKLTDSTTNKITYEIYQFYDYFTDASAPTVIRNRWKKICDIDQVVSKDTQIAGVEIQDGISLGDLLTAILSTNITATTNQPVAGRTIFQYLLNNYVGFQTTNNPDGAKDGHTLYIDGTHGNDLLFVVPTNNKITQYQICADGTIKSRYCVATSGVQTGSWQGWVALVSTNNIQDSAVTTPKINDGAVTEDKLASNSVTTSKIKDGEITPSKLDRQYEKVISCSGNEIDTANDSQAIYIHHANGGFKGIVFFTGYNNYAGVTTVKQFRLCKDGKVEYRTGTVVIPTTTPNTYTWDKTYDENWNPIGSTQNIQDGAVTLDKLSSNVKELITSLKTAIDNKIVVFSYTLPRNAWNNNQQTISVPSGYIVTGDVVADTDFSSLVYNQLCADGCCGIYIDSVTNGNVLTLTAHALGNTPTADIDIQVTLTAITNLDD